LWSDGADVDEVRGVIQSGLKIGFQDFSLRSLPWKLFFSLAIPQIKKALNIGGVLTNTSSWKSTSTKKGAQIDLVIDRRDQVVNLCEVKYSINPYTITKSYAENLRNKIGVFRNETKTGKSLFLTMITTYGLEENTYSKSLVQNELTMDVLFE